MNSTQQLLAMMRETATKHFNEGKITAEWNEEAVSKFTKIVENTSEKARLDCLADKEGIERFTIFGVVMLNCFEGRVDEGTFQLKKEEEESDEQDTDGSDEDLNGAISVSGSAF